MIDLPGHQHEHDHDHSALPHTHLTSVGIDIGSSTSHLMFSQLTIGYPSAYQRQPQVLERRIISRSPVLLTPFSGDWNIDPEPLKALISSAFDDAGLNPDSIDTGAVIITGEAARRENAQRIAELFSEQAGKFVCATAGPRLEGILAAHGSGAVARSRAEGTTLLHVDLGGGTTKVGLIERGKVVDLTALNIGARLIAHDDHGSLVRLESAGDRFLRDLGQPLALGDHVEEATKREVASRMAEALFAAIAGEAPFAHQLFVTPPLRDRVAVDGILFSGGVSEYIYRRETAGFGDLGPLFGSAVRDQALKRGYVILDAGEGIRATVIGASAFSVQLSGETIFVPDAEALPLHNLRIFTSPVTWETPIAERIEQAVGATLGRRDPEVVGSPFALAIESPPFFGYGAAQQLAEGIRRALLALRPVDRPNILVFNQNIGQVVGAALASDLGIPSIDEVSLSELDFIDVGRIVAGETYVPVVIKSLAFEF